MSHLFFALNIVLFFSCTVHHLGVKPEKTEYIEKQNNTSLTYANTTLKKIRIY